MQKLPADCDAQEHSAAMSNAVAVRRMRVARLTVMPGDILRR
ncbi:MAG: hypothetical protein R3C68_09050 [Myxococcota bacterium]